MTLTLYSLLTSKVTKTFINYALKKYIYIKNCETKGCGAFEIISSEHVAHDLSESVQQHRLVFRFQYHQVHVNFFAVK